MHTSKLKITSGRDFAIPVYEIGLILSTLQRFFGTNTDRNTIRAFESKADRVKELSN